MNKLNIVSNLQDRWVEIYLSNLNCMLYKRYLEDLILYNFGIETIV